MNAGKLREFLEGLDDCTIVVLSSDAEGNQFIPVAEATDGFRYDEEESYLIDPADSEHLGERWRDATPCAILWPY